MSFADVVTQLQQWFPNTVRGGINCGSGEAREQEDTRTPSRVIRSLQFPLFGGGQKHARSPLAVQRIHCDPELDGQPDLPVFTF